MTNPIPPLQVEPPSDLWENDILVLSELICPHCARPHENPEEFEYAVSDKEANFGDFCGLKERVSRGKFYSDDYKLLRITRDGETIWTR